MIAPRAVEPPPAAERDRFAQRALMAFLNRPNVRIVSSEQSASAACRATRSSRESRTSAPGDDLVMVQWLRFGSGGVVQMFGIARKDQWADGAAAHARAARRLRRQVAHKKEPRPKPGFSVSLNALQTLANLRLALLLQLGLRLRHVVLAGGSGSAVVPCGADATSLVHMSWNTTRPVRRVFLGQAGAGRGAATPGQPRRSRQQPPERRRASGRCQRTWTWQRPASGTSSG